MQSLAALMKQEHCCTAARCPSPACLFTMSSNHSGACSSASLARSARGTGMASPLDSMRIAPARGSGKGGRAGRWTHKLAQ